MLTVLVWWSTVEAHLPSVLEIFRPDLVLYDAGVDPHWEDELGRLRLTDQGERKLWHPSVSTCKLSLDRLWMTVSISQGCIAEICTWWRPWWAEASPSPPLSEEDTRGTSTNWPSDTPSSTEQRLRCCKCCWMTIFNTKSLTFTGSEWILYSCAPYFRFGGSVECKTFQATRRPSHPHWYLIFRSQCQYLRSGWKQCCYAVWTSCGLFCLHQFLKGCRGYNGFLTDPTHAPHPSTFLASNRVLVTFLFSSENSLFCSVMEKLMVKRDCVITSLIL